MLTSNPAPALLERNPALQVKSQRDRMERKAAPVFITKVDDAMGVVSAVVNVFGITDDYDDIIHAGAFTKTISERAGRVRVLDQHNTSTIRSVLGKPILIREIGRSELPSDVLAKYPQATGGLLTETQYLMETPEGKGAFDRIKSGAVNEYSIGFDVLDVDYGKVKGADGREKVVRNIRTVRLWEYSPVIWGANPATATVQAKSADSPSEQKAQTIGAILQASLLYCLNMRADDLFSWDLVTLEERQVISDATFKALVTLAENLPEELRERIYQSPYSTWSASDPDESKAGRVLSEKNAARIKSAAEAITVAAETLTDVLEGAGLIDEAAADKSGKAAENESKQQQPTDAGSSEASPTLQAITLELIELEQLEVNEHELQG